MKDARSNWKLRLTSELRSAIPRILTRFARKYVAVGLVWMMVGSLVLNAIVMFAGNGGIAAVSGAKLDSIGKSVVGSKTASVTWSSPTQITHGAWESGSAYMHPDVFVDGVNICAVWMDGRDNQNLDYDLYFISSLNGGASWQTEKRISTYGEYSSDPVVVANNGMVHVFVEDQGTLWYIYSSDMVLWSNKSLISADKSIEDYKVAMSGMMLYFVWSERVDLYNFDIYLLKSTDLGETWSAEFKIASIYSASTHCRLEIATSSEKLYVVSDGGFIRSDDGGSSWGSFNSSLNGCHVKANGQYVHIMKGTAYGYEGYARSEDFGNTWSTVNTTIKGKIAAPGNYVYVVNGSQYFLSTNNGISFGDANTIPSISPVSPYCTSVDVSPSGRAHVVYEGWVSGEGHTEIFYVHSVISHAPIYINGNAGFTAENGVSNPGAAGTEIDPYIIENWDINASSANGIEIRNTDKYFIIRSCVIHDGIPNYHGIYFYNVTYGKIENVTSYNNDEGIYLFSSSDNNLTNCRISFGYIGIHLQDYSSKNNILNCNISLSSYWGILIACSSNNNVIGNDLNNNLVGLVVGGNLKEFWNQTIGITNIINGKPVYYFFDLNNKIIEDLDTSHITLAWCTNISLKNCKVSNGDGLIIACTQNSAIEFCNFSKNSRGIWVDQSSNNTFTSCDISFNTWVGGFLMSDSFNNTIISCDLLSNSGDGIMLQGASNNTIANCTIYNTNNKGVFLAFSSNNNTIYHNNFINNTQNAYDECSNSWDNNYPSGGNYWSDYTGSDLYSGVNQDELGSDGIGDKAYNISGGSNQDRYPLMEPVNITVNQPPIVNITYPIEGQTVNGTVTITGTAYDPDSGVGVGKVHNLDKDTWYQTIQAAVDDADIGNRIFVYSGVYYENVVINKSLSLIGEDKETTIIDGNGSVVISVVFDFASGTGGWKTSIKNFTIINSTTAGIQFSSSDFNDVANCIIYSTKYGVYLYGGGYNIISKCNIFDNNIGINSEFSHSNSFTNCSIQSNSWDGIYLYSSSFNCIMNCSISNNYYGIKVIEYYYTSPSENNIIYHNNFINNTNQAYDECTNFWDNSSVGNHWSDYTGVDANGDGIGDTPYSIPGGTNKDRYPLMNPANITLGKYPQKNNQLDTDTNPQKNGISNGTTVQFVEIKIDSGSWQLATGTTSWSFAWDTTTVTNGWHTIYARAYDGIDYSEIKSVNVYVNNPISLPDLVIPAIIILPSETVSNGTYITINATVCNDGYGVVYNVTVEVYINNTLIHTEIIPAISPNTTAVVSTVWFATQIGNHTIRVVIDPDDMIAESNETNNEASKNITVSEARWAWIEVLTTDKYYYVINETINTTVVVRRGNDMLEVVYEGIVTLTVCDSTGTMILNVSKNVSIPSSGENVTLLFSFSLDESGTYIIKAELWSLMWGYELDDVKTTNITVVAENTPPVANFTYYQGFQALDGEYINVTLRVAGEKYRVVNLTVYENETKIGLVSVERIPGSPQEQQNTTSILINSSKLYNIALEYTADEKGGNPVWVIINYTGVRSFSYTYHMVFHENDIKALNLTEILETCTRAIGLVKFDASASFDYDGWLTNWLWNFGDSATGGGKIIWHAYNTGSYTVTLTVTDNNYSSASATQNITILDYLGYFASARNQFGIALRCPADLTITNATGAFVGLNVSSGKHENWLPNAAMIISSDIEIYFAPNDFNYTYTIRGLEPGDFTLLFSPGDFAPDKLYQIESNTSAESVDVVRVTSEGNTIILTSNSDKFYSLYITNGTKTFSLRNVPINRNATHIYEITNWSAINETGIASVNLTVDELSDGIVDRVEELWNNFNIADIFKPDLAIIEFEISKLQAKVGENITVRVTLKNLGNYPAKNIKVRFLVNNVSYGEDFEILLLAREDSRELIFYWTGNVEGSYWLSICIDPDNTIKELREDNNLESDTVEIIKEAVVPSAPPALPSAAIIGGAIATTIVIAAALAGTEVGKHGFFSLFGPLFVKRKTAVLDQFTRGRIYNFIELNPGAHYNLIKSRLDISNGTLSYHLTLLEKEGYIKSETEGMYKRFYLTGKINAIEKAQLPLSDLQQDIVDLVRTSPGITQKEITVRTNKSRQIISYNIKVLTRVGIINKRKEGMKSRLYFEEKYT